MLTAQELGVPFTPAQTSGSGGEGDSDGGGGVTRRHGQASLGLQGFARQALQRYDSEGHNLARVAALQGAVRQQQGGGGGGGGGGFSQAAEVMQQYSRLALLTVEAAAAAGLPINRPVQEPTTVTAPTDYAPALLAGWRPGGGGGGGEPQDEAASPETAASVEDGGDVRGAAVHLLVAFMGAVLGAPYSLQQFLAAAADAYAAGHSAAELLGALKGDEFLQAGGLLPVAAPGPGAEVDITRQLFARCARRAGARSSWSLLARLAAAAFSPLPSSPQLIMQLIVPSLARFASITTALPPSDALVGTQPRLQVDQQRILHLCQPGRRLPARRRGRQARLGLGWRGGRGGGERPGGVCGADAGAGRGGGGGGRGGGGRGGRAG
jgi:hypothetical protein